MNYNQVYKTVSDSSIRIRMIIFNLLSIKLESPTMCRPSSHDITLDHWRVDMFCLPCHIKHIHAEITKVLEGILKITISSQSYSQSFGDKKRNFLSRKFWSPQNGLLGYLVQAEIIQLTAPSITKKLLLPVPSKIESSLSSAFCEWIPY